MDQPTQTAVLHPLVGQTVHQYHVERVLGQGGMGVVYHAHDTKLQRPVALKLLSSELVGDEDRRRRFLREARAAARVIHPAIAQVYDVDEYQGATFIAMEWVEGKTVRDLIRDHELDLLGAIDIAIQVADGLTKAHAMGIVHRDIKPANVMLTPDAHAKILDFGLAKWVAAGDTTGAQTPGQPSDLTLTQTQLGQVMGTAAYMSPEQVKGLPVDARSDLFSLGVMLFEMTTSELPFRRPTMMETLHAVAFDDTPSVQAIRHDLPLGLQRIVARCLQKRPADRYADAPALAQDLRALRRDTESGLTRSTDWRQRALDAWERVAHLDRKQWIWAGLSAVILVALLYAFMANVGLGGFLLFAFIGLQLIRYVRNRPQRMLERFTRAVAKIPEVRIIAAHQGNITVVVDRAPGQLYGRINQQLNEANRKLFTGKPMTAVIRHDLSLDETSQLLTGPGVQYVREDAVQLLPPPNPNKITKSDFV